MAMKLYGMGPMRSLRVLWAMQELGLEHEFEQVNVFAGETQDPAFLRLNPAGKIPVLVDGDLVLTESAAIVLYLAEKYHLLPAELAERAQVYRWTLFTVTELEQPLTRMANHSAIYPEHLRLPAELDLAKRDFTRMVAVLERHMAGRDFVVGSELTAADCVLAYTLDWANECKLLESCPHLVAYLDRMYSRPGAPSRIAKAFADLGQQP